MSSSDERSIVDRAAKGDVDAFESLVKAYEKKLYNMAYRLVSDPEDALDVVQEVFLKTYQALPNFRGDSQFSTWLYRVCVNTCLDHLRKDKKSKSYSLDAPMDLGDSEVQRQVEDDGISTEDAVEMKSTGEEILEIINQLDPHYRTALILCDVHDYSYKEIAEILNVSLGTVKSRIHRARNLVRKLYQAEQSSGSSVKSSEKRGGN